MTISLLKIIKKEKTMTINKKSLEIFQVAVADWDDNNRSSENYEEDGEILNEMYQFLWNIVWLKSVKLTSIIVE
tara:strand:+ start:658 stop:879 length:222 start_codon:yes stop_codon:yes gene_type:complete